MNIEGQFIRIYKRSSKSPWSDHSTLLLLANAKSDDDSLTLDFSRYIYLHRDSAGKTLGLSLSKSIITESELDCGQYIEGAEMYTILLIFLNEISDFCELFAQEFEALFLTPPAQYFAMAAEYWVTKLD